MDNRTIFRCTILGLRFIAGIDHCTLYDPYIMVGWSYNILLHVRLQWKGPALSVMALPREACTDEAFRSCTAVGMWMHSMSWQ